MTSVVAQDDHTVRWDFSRVITEVNDFSTLTCAGAAPSGEDGGGVGSAYLILTYAEVITPGEGWDAPPDTGLVFSNGEGFTTFQSGTIA